MKDYRNQPKWEDRGLPKNSGTLKWMVKKPVVKKYLCECGKEKFINNRKYCEDCRSKMEV